jgi:excisionase family DNA binding protein
MVVKLRRKKMADGPQAYSVNETAEMLQVHPQTLYRAIKKGEVKAVRVSGKGSLRIPRKEADRLLGKE